MKENSRSTSKSSNAVANQVTQKKSKGNSLPSAQPAQLESMEEELPAQGKFKPGASTNQSVS